MWGEIIYKKIRETNHPVLSLNTDTDTDIQALEMDESNFSISQTTFAQKGVNVSGLYEDVS